MTLLRKRFTDHLTLRRYSPKTIEAYIASVKGLAFYYNLSPDKLSNEQIQAYLQHLIQGKKQAWSTCNVAFCGIKCFYENIMQRDTKLVIPPRTRSKKRPEILSQEEVLKVVNTFENLKHRAILLAVYSAGLRVCEVVTLRPENIEKNRGLIRVENGKGRKCRYTILSNVFLNALKEYKREYRPEKWLFFGRDINRPMSVSSAQKIYYAAKERIGMTKTNGIHTLRHCFATHLIEQGTDIKVIQEMLGHRYLSTTANYIHISNKHIASINSPLDNLNNLERQ